MIDNLQVTWLASYPKSGNTWMRFLLYNYFYDQVNNSREVEIRIPDIHALPGQRIDPNVHGSHLCKTHFLWNREHPNHVHTIRAIYILRHPKDVLLSNLNYFRLLSECAIDPEKFARSFIDSMGASYWQSHNIGSLVENVRSWTQEFSHPCVVVRYEDLHKEPEETLGKVLSFLGIDPDEDRVSAAIRASTFDRMQSLEEREREQQKHGFVFQIHPDVQKYDSACRFMNQGKVGQTLDSIHPELDEILEERFGSFLQQYGYSNQ